MRAVRAIHRDDIRQAPRRVGTTIVGRDPHSCGRVDVIGRMAGIGDRDLVDLCRSRAKAYRRCARRRVRHRKTFAAARGILGGSRYDQLTQQGKRDGKRSQHGGGPWSGSGHTVSRNPGAAISRAATSGAKITPIAISTTSILARMTREAGSGAVATKSAASSPEIVSHASPPASWPAAITMTGVISTMANEPSAKLRHSN